eukprot:2171297-Rhodomonas_salina.1
MWACRICTLENGESDDECGACGEERSHAELKKADTAQDKRKAADISNEDVKQSKEESEEEGKWTCPACTLVNDDEEERCVACLAAPPSKRKRDKPSQGA